MHVGFIGLGAMGSGMARNVAKTGLLQCVFNRTRSTAEQLARELEIANPPSIASLAAQVDVILLCVAADDDVQEVIEAIAATVKPDSVVIDLSTVDRDTAIQAAALLAKQQAAFLDAPVSGGVEGAINGTLSMMVGGDTATLEKVRPVLEAMTRSIVYMGKTGSGQSTKAVNQIMAAGINQAVTEALAFANAQGLPMEKVIDVVAAGAAGNWFLQHRGPSMIKDTYAPGFKLALHYKDLKICKRMADKAALSTKILDLTLADYEQLLAEGHGHEDISTLFRLKLAEKGPQTR